METIPQQFATIARKFSQRPALKFKFQGAYISLSFSNLQKQINVLVQGLQALGLQKGERLAILSENRSEWVRADLASLTLGAISVPVHTTLSPVIIQHILNDCGAKILLVSNQTQLAKIALVADQLTALATIIYINLDAPANQLAQKKLISLEAVMKLGKNSSAEIKVSASRHDVATIIYTSGTTALPKGVMLSHHNLLFDAEAALTVVPVTEKDILLSFLPLSHVLERTAGYYAPLVLRGACVAYAENPKTLAQNLKEIRPTILISVPRIFEKIHTSIWEKVKSSPKFKRQLFVWALKQTPGTWAHQLADWLVFKKIKRQLGGKFRFTISGGASLNPKLARFFDRLGLKIIEGYGLTETSPVITVNRPNRYKFGTVGQQLPGVEIQIAADKEILTRGPMVMKGYYNNQTLTQETIDTTGWLHTGDLGFIDNEGFLTIIGRKKEMISLSNGKIVWPEQLEIILDNDRFINQSMIYGNNRSYLIALLIPDWPEVNRDLETLGISGKEPEELINEPKLQQLFRERLDKINEQLADWEKIRKFTLLAKEFSQEKDELTPTLKLRRKTIEEHYKKQLENLYQK